MLLATPVCIFVLGILAPIQTGDPAAIITGNYWRPWHTGGYYYQNIRRHVQKDHRKGGRINMASLYRKPYVDFMREDSAKAATSPTATGINTPNAWTLMTFSPVAEKRTARSIIARNCVLLLAFYERNHRRRRAGRRRPQVCDTLCHVSKRRLLHISRIRAAGPGLQKTPGRGMKTRKTFARARRYSFKSGTAKKAARALSHGRVYRLGQKKEYIQPRQMFFRGRKD